MRKLPKFQKTSAELNQILLLTHFKNNKMSSAETLEDIIMIKRAEILSNYHIWQNETNGRWCVNLGKEKRRIMRKEKSDIENAILEFHLCGQRMNTTFAEAFDDWSSYMKENNTHAMKTVNEYSNEYKRYMATNSFISLPMSQITERDLVHFLKDVVQGNEGITHKRFSNVKTIIRSVFNHAKIEMDIDCIAVRNIMDDIRFPATAFQMTAQQDNPQVFKISEIAKIKKHLNGTTRLEELGILLTIETGLRVGELATLRRDDVVENKLTIRRSEHKADFGGDFRYFIDTPKKNKTRTVMLSDEALGILNRILELHDSEWLFPSENLNYGWIRTYNFDKAIRRVCRELGITERSMHKIRKTYSSMLLSQGVPDKLVQCQLGHSDIKTTHQSYYYDISDEEEKTCIFNRIKIG